MCNTLQMKRYFSGISIVVMLMIVLSSIIQFHHHDDKGNIIFAVSAICHNEIDHEKHNAGGILSGCCHCEHDEHDCGSGNECSAHLGDYQATKQTSISIDNHPTLLLYAIFYEPEINTLNRYYISENSYFDVAPPIVEGVFNSVGLRAPPYC